MTSRVCSLLGALFCAAVCSLAAAKGTVTLDFGVNSDDKLLSLRVGQDGRIYTLVDTDSGANRCALYALDESGTLVAGFGNAGRVRTRTFCVTDFAVRTDGSVVTAVDRTGSPGVNLVSYDANGKELSISSTNAPIGSSSRFQGFAMSLQADNKILVAGRLVLSPGTWEVLRWNADGTVDEPFDAFISNGVAAAASAPDALAVSASGKILVGGLFGTDSYQNRLYQRLDTGRQDTTFATGGLFTAPGTFTANKHAPGGLAVDPTSGRIYLLPNNSVDLIALTSAGVADSAFSTLATPGGRVPQSVVVDSSGRAIVAGVSSERGALQAYLSRFTASGALDTTFGTEGTGLSFGFLTRPIFDAAPSCRVAIQNTTSELILACTVDNGADAQGLHVSDLTIARFFTNGTLDTAFGAAQKDSDIRPDTFAFNTDSAPANTANVQSNTVTLAGFDGPTTVRLQGTNADGSMFSVGCDGTFTDQPAQISAGQTLCVRHHASPTPQGTAQTGIDVGGLYVTYTTQSTSAVADTTPDAFTFSPLTQVTPSIGIVSETITPTGFDGVAPISVQNGDYYINCDRSKDANQPATIASGQSVCVRQTTSDKANTSVTTTLTIGGVSGAFTTTTTADGGTGVPPGFPGAFTFTSQNGVALSTQVVSNAVTVTGFSTPPMISITNGEYSVGCTQNFTSAAGTIANGTQFCVRHLSASTTATSVKTDIVLDGGTARYTTSFMSTTVGSSTNVTTPTDGDTGGGGKGGGGGALDYGFLAALMLIAGGTALPRRSRPRSGRLALFSQPPGD